MNRDYQCITHPLLNQDMWVFPHEKYVESFNETAV